MNVLAIETATPACAVGLATADREITAVLDDARHHTESLVPGLAEVLARAGLTARDVDRVVVDRGPGLFTGLRVGVATALGLCLATGAELVGVTSLELLAQGARRAGVRGALVACVDGRRGEVFVQAFDLDDEVRARDEPAVATPAAVAERWAGRGVTLTGDGVTRYEEVLLRSEGVVVFDQRVPPPREALALGATRAPSATLTPLYLREADAVANFATRTRRP